MHATTSEHRTDERWTTVRRLFDEALSLDPAARDAYLRRAAADEAVLAAVYRLIAAHEAFTGTGEAPGADPVARAIDAMLRDGDLDAGAQIAEFRLERLLGEGGMGRVYLAQRQVAGVVQRVALKIVPFAVHERRTIERLRHERAILATLDHPGIARLIDAGELPDERPYFAMEYVDGVAITRYCDERTLDLCARLTLFADVCEAVAYAHRRLVLHRDLKPGNILVDRDGRVRLVDFGIAKSLDGVAANGEATVDGGFFSIGSAAPEQVLGLPTSVATDVYGLGCVLHELLAGVLPFRFANFAREAIVDTIVHRPAGPASESARANDTAARQRQLPDGNALAAALRGDLDAIVAKTLRKEPNDRYRSVDDLAADVRNVLAFRPIALRASEFRYRSRLLLRRNRLTAATALALGIAVLAAGTSSIVLSRRAAAERDRAVAALATAQLQRDHARRVTSFLVDAFEAADPVKARGRELRADELLASAVASLQQNPAKQDPALRATIAQTLAHLFFALDRLPESLQQAQIARTAFDAAGGTAADLAANQALTDAEAAFVQTRYNEAIAISRDALARPGSAIEDGDLAYNLHLVRNRATAASGRYREAEKRYEETIAQLSGRRDIGVDRIERLRQQHAQVLSDNDRNADARARLEALLAEQRARGSADDPALTETLRLLAQTLLRLGAAPEDKDELYRLAGLYNDEALARHTAMYGDDNAMGAYLLRNKATLLAVDGTVGEAMQIYRRAADIGARRIGERSAFMVLLYMRMSHHYRDLFGDAGQAEYAARKALAASPSEGSVSRAASLMILANLLAAQDRRFEAEYYVDTALSLLSPEHLERAYLDLQLAWLYFRQYRFDDAAALLTPYVVRGVTGGGTKGANRERYEQLLEMAAFYRFRVP
ncbi:serine/threonine-protein kinase [Tahibacter soli]|uniref:Serine/threonine-protein kinase n=1 Tax=Tahibacter soli TaxID=2983605 RepID=A0A9X4BGG8_9GAMM|nr:serine/threonine-protein kinase [Tahibacter soli]MDC8011053.1 serine/threonine-protein kinase [Tahibacter soli]